MSERWLISYEYRARHRRPDGGYIPSGPIKTVSVIDQHPAKYIAEHKMDKYDREGDNRLTDDITIVYWAMPLPDGVLTGEEIDALS